jgi:hypothetical protein
LHQKRDLLSFLQFSRGRGDRQIGLTRTRHSARLPVGFACCIV